MTPLRIAASVALAGVALIGVTAPASASKPTTKPDTTHKQVCHPTGKGWVLINPSQASSHIDESAYPNGHYWKHEHDGRHDTYAVSGACPVVPSTPTPTTTGGTPSATTTHSTTAPPPSTGPTGKPSSPSPSHTSSPSPTTPSPTVTTRPSGTPSATSTAGPTTPRNSPSPASSSPSKATSTQPPSPRRSVPSSTVAPPELAHTGAGLVTGFLVGLGILLVGALFHGARILGGRKGTHR